MPKWWEAAIVRKYRYAPEALMELRQAERGHRLRAWQVDHRFEGEDRMDAHTEICRAMDSYRDKVVSLGHGDPEHPELKFREHFACDPALARNWRNLGLVVQTGVGGCWTLPSSAHSAILARPLPSSRNTTPYLTGTPAGTTSSRERRWLPPQVLRRCARSCQGRSF